MQKDVGEVLITEVEIKNKISALAQRLAVDRRPIKLGSKLRIEGFPNTIFRADDVGGAIKGKHVDLWFPSHRKALEFGRQKLVVELVSG